MNLEQVKEFFDANTEGAEPDGTKYFLVDTGVAKNPYRDLSNYATADLRVAQAADKNFYAATTGTLDGAATEIKE